MIFYLIAFIFVLTFTKGILEIYGISESIVQLSVDVLIILMFCYSLLSVIKNKKIIGPGIGINITLFTIILTSFILTSVSELQMILFVRKFGIYYLFFYALFNINLSDVQKEKLFKLIMILFLIQIPAALFKLITFGTIEHYIGTMSIKQGSMATIIPIMAISYLIARYLEFRKIKDLVLILLFIAIGLISNKMAILFYVMIMFVTLSYFYSLKNTQGFNLLNMIFIKKMMTVLVILVFISLAFISLNPRANPEGIVGGSIDMDYLARYIDDYQNLKEKGSRIEGEGRFEAPGLALDRLSSKGWLHVVLGFGPGDIVQSSYLRYENPLLEKYNIGYGGRIALVWVMMQIGLIGVVLFTLFHLVLFKRLWKVYLGERVEAKQSASFLGILGFPIIYILDFYTYSTILVQESAAVTSYFFAIFYMLTKNENIIIKGQI